MTPTARRPRVAVVIPVYNHERYVEAAIASVLSQTRPPDRVIVVDDGSHDGSRVAAARALAAAGPIQVELRAQTNRGAARTLNETIGALNEDIIGILNSDDAWETRRLEHLLPTLDADQPCITFSGVECFGDADQPDLAQHPRWMAEAFALGACFPAVGFALLLSNIAISSGNLLFSRKLYEEVGGFDETMPICHDWQFLLDALPLTEPVFVADPLYRYRIHGTNTYREQADPSGREIRSLHRAYLAWATARTTNPLAPAAPNFPRWMPYFALIWQRHLPAAYEMLTRHLLALSRRSADQPTILPVGIEQAWIADALTQFKNSSRTDGPPALAEARMAAAARWQDVRQRILGVTPTIPRVRPSRSAAATFSWAGAATVVATHDVATLRDLSELTGLVAEPSDVVLGRADLNALPAQTVFVQDQLRHYRNDEDRLIWLALTLGEFLSGAAACPLLHAAAIVVEERAVLLCGAPHAGKSTTTLRALARGLTVLGDDQVRVAVGAPRVQALPRPVKLRVPLSAPLPDGVKPQARPLRGMLEDEETLMLRRGNAVSPDDWLPITAVFHLSRGGGNTCVIRELALPEARGLLVPQLRGWNAEAPNALDAQYVGLLQVPHFALEIGEHRTDEALDRVMVIAGQLRADRSRIDP